MSERYPMVPTPDGVPAFDYRAPSPLLQRGIARLEALTAAHQSPVEFLWIFELSEVGELGKTELAGDVMLIGADVGIFALDRISGELRWSIDPPEAGCFNPDDCFHVATDLVLVQKAGIVTAYDVATGEESWSFDVSSSGGLRRSWMGSGPIYDHMELVGLDADVAFHVLDAATGEETCAYWCQHSSSRALGDLLYIIDHNTYVLALDPRKNEVIWKSYIAHGLPILSSLEVHDGIILVMSGTTRWKESKWPTLEDDHIIRAFDGRTGEQLWQAKPAWKAYAVEVPTVEKTMVYLRTAWGEVSALDLQTGKEQWRLQSKHTRPQFTPAGGLVYVNDEDQRLIALDVKSGEERWRFQSPHSSPGFVAIHGDVAYINTAAALYALDVADGSERWQFSFECPEFGSDLIVTINEDGDTAYIASPPHFNSHKHDDGTVCDVGTVYAVDTTTGQLKWKIYGFDTITSIQSMGRYVCVVWQTMAVAFREPTPTELPSPNQPTSFLILEEYEKCMESIRTHLVKKGGYHFKNRIFRLS